ncbi:MAG: hypothetical protein PHG00_10555 [Methylococcales bacterium]|nr:hypothetical protein [Methylococcales bacterium]
MLSYYDLHTALVASGFTVPSISTISTIALIGAIPMTLAVILVVVFGVETCKRRLEDITADELKVVAETRLN